MAAKSAILFFVVFAYASVGKGCNVDDVAVYNVTLRGLWNEERYPKDYPKEQPIAQWSSIFGQSHNSSYKLYSLGEQAKESFKSFAHNGDTKDLVKEGNVDSKVFDQFNAKDIYNGVGISSNLLLVDGEHSLLSVISRISPSPDWFVGVDSVDLCLDSTWVDGITLDLTPLDAGVASGLSFTSPRWDTIPQEPITKIETQSTHPSAAFYYPESRMLPTIAQIEINKVKEFTTKELNEFARKHLKKYVNIDDNTENNFKGQNDENDKVIQEGNFRRKFMENTKHQHENRQKLLKDTRENSNFGSAETNLKDTSLYNMDEVVLAVANGRKLGLNKHLPRHFKSRLHHAVNRIMPNDCLVSEWSDWTPCSTSCGFGEKLRSREVMRQPSGRGRPCPVLIDRASCGSDNFCDF